MEYVEFLKALKPILKKHDGKVFGKRFESDLKAVMPGAYISHYAGLQYIYLDKDTRQHVGWDKRPIEAARVCGEIDRTIEHQLKSNAKRANDLKNINEIKNKFKQLKELIEFCDELHHETREELKKEFDLDFKTYFRG